MIESTGARTTFLVLTLFTLMAGDAWRYTIGWTGFAIVVGLLAVISVVLLIVQRDRWNAGLLPYPLIAFLVLTVLSLAWSFYPGATALGLAATWSTVVGGVAVAVTFSWAEILRGLGLALRFVLGLSLVFEFVVAAFIRRPVLPPVPEPGIDYAALPDKIPPMLYWSRNELFQVFDDGKIQGIVGNSTLLSFVALLGIIVFGIQLAGGLLRKRWGFFWLTIADRQPRVQPIRHQPHRPGRRDRGRRRGVAGAAGIHTAGGRRHLPRPDPHGRGGHRCRAGLPRAAARAARQEPRPHQPHPDLDRRQRAGPGTTDTRLGLGELLGAVGQAVRQPR